MVVELSVSGILWWFVLLILVTTILGLIGAVIVGATKQ